MSVLKILIFLHLYPHIFYTFNPFKIHEFRLLLKDIAFAKGERLLDIGCGVGLQTVLLGKLSRRIIGVDISQESINHARARSQYFAGKIDSQFYNQKMEEVGFEDEYFDKIFSFCVIEHIPNYEEIFREAYRTLKKEGMFIFSCDSLSTLNGEEVKKIHKERYYVCHYFQAKELKSLLEGIGFRQVNIFPSCRSEFAKKLFIKGIYNDFQYSRIGSLWDYFLLQYNERRWSGQGEAGIFLMVKCRK